MQQPAMALPDNTIYSFTRLLYRFFNRCVRDRLSLLHASRLQNGCIIAIIHYLHAINFFSLRHSHLRYSHFIRSNANFVTFLTRASEFIHVH